MVPTPRSSPWAEPARRLEEGVAHFPDMVAYADEIVGRLVQHVSELDLREKTLILFYSDNGTDRRITSRWRGRDVQGGKGETTQNGIRVPLIASWPGTVKPGTCRDLVDPTDFMRTLAELAGHKVPVEYGDEGVSFAGALFDKDDRKRREWSFCWYDPRPGWDKERFTRQIFALDHDYKLFSDGRLFAIAGDGFTENPVAAASADPTAAAARAKLQDMIDRIMRPPLSAAALADPAEFGKP
jgi:arylsulfatase A-like enzyme